MTRRAPAAAIVWCLGFAVLHLYWALGGSVGLASSAGAHLARTRPAVFVVLGLYGVAALLTVGALVVGISASGRASRGRRRIAGTLLGVAGGLLLLRAVVLEVVLLADLGGVRDQVGPLETHWSLALWNPWFALGGALLCAASAGALR